MWVGCRSKLSVCLHNLQTNRMGDVADILGMVKPKDSTAAEVASQIMTDAKPKATSQKRKKPKGMAREVYDLLGPDGIVPSMETNKVSTGFKNKRASALRGRWVWAPFTSSARSDQQPFYHWAKADVQFNDYNYVKFNVKLDNLAMYTGRCYISRWIFSRYSTPA